MIPFLKIQSGQVLVFRNYGQYQKLKSTIKATHTHLSSLALKDPGNNFEKRRIKEPNESRDHFYLVRCPRSEHPRLEDHVEKEAWP